MRGSVLAIPLVLTILSASIAPTLIAELTSPRQDPAGEASLNDLGSTQTNGSASGQDGRLRNPARVGGSHTTYAPIQLHLVLQDSVRHISYPPYDPEAKKFHLVSEIPSRFMWEGWSVDEIDGYSWALVDSLEQEDPDWTPWSIDSTSTTVTLSVPDTLSLVRRYLLVRERDSAGRIFVADAHLFVRRWARERRILVVDDFPVEGDDWPGDEEHDRFLVDTLLADAANRGIAVDLLDPFDPDTGLFSPDRLSPDSLSRYKIIVWNTFGYRSVLPYSGIRYLNAAQTYNWLSYHLDQGGDLWILGTSVFSSLKYDNSSSPGHDPFGSYPQDFVWKYLNLRSVYGPEECMIGCFMNSLGSVLDQRAHGFEIAEPTAAGQLEGLDTLVVTAPFDSPHKGVPFCEGRLSRNGLSRMNSETLFTYVSNGRAQVFPPIDSHMDHTATAFRYQHPDRGCVVAFGFPVVFFSADAAQHLGATVLDWFLGGCNPINLTSVQISPEEGALRISWCVSGTEDYVAFDVIRESDSDRPSCIAALRPVNNRHRFEILDSDVIAGIVYDYYLEAVNRNGNRETLYLGAGVLESAITAWQFDCPHPNPFISHASIPYEAPECGVLQVRIYDVSGRLVRTLTDERVDIGTGQITWDGRTSRNHHAAAGVYFLEINVDDNVITKKLVRLLQ